MYSFFAAYTLYILYADSKISESYYIEGMIFTLLPIDEDDEYETIPTADRPLLLKMLFNRSR